MSTDKSEVVDEIEKNLPTIPSRYFRRPHKKRLREVRTLYFIRGWSKAEIADALKVSERTIEKDITFLKSYGKTLAKKDVEYRNDALNFLWEMSDNYKERIKHLWNDYNKANSEQVKVEILREIRQQEKQYFEMLQSLGILPKEAEKFIHGITYVSHLRPEEEKNEKTISTTAIVNSITQ